ncbi:hypothetical protein HYFRA_00013008 [Hymenoscyphus fraxineus]|uniref:Uncharacterized protein n=1 Tax=Hymenoscyphus fraxineus TaxID=746836 RepID=A0A9N9L7J8_9HELO|nr:hypothetical protein HYFRA_00013008 [Hymenoscyphus fraxineus]
MATNSREEAAQLSSTTTANTPATPLPPTPAPKPAVFGTLKPWKIMESHQGIIRWSPNPSRDEFLVLNLYRQTVQVYEATGHAQPGKFDYEPRSVHTKLPAILTYDWSPAVQGLVAVGTNHGEVHLLRVDDDSSDSITLPLKLQRPCQSIAFNTTGLLAVGLDRIRNDSCLQIWDINQRLGNWDSKQLGWGNSTVNIEPRKKLEASVSITSVRFFEDQPQTLVVGVKNQSVRIHDLRDPNSSVMQFQTRCNNNLAIDFADTNYFASSSLDQAGLVVWDKRASSRSTASPMYLEYIDQEPGVAWGSALTLDNVIQMEKGVHIKQLRYCREHRGMLGVLSSAGQLQVLKTNREYIEPDSIDDVKGSPELLEVKKSIDLEYASFDANHPRKTEDRIVSFDWLNLGTPDLDPRIVGLRANGSFEILQMPAASAGQLTQLIPWTAPRRLNEPYMTLMRFKDPEDAEKMLGPLYATAAKSDIPVFGPNGFNNLEVKKNLNAAIQKAIHSGEDPVVNLLCQGGSENEETAAFGTTEPLAGQLSDLAIKDKADKGKGKEKAEPEVRSYGSMTSRELHDRVHYATQSCVPAPKHVQDRFDNMMVRRAVAGYLFDPETNVKLLLDDDPWLVRVWYWVSYAKALRNTRAGMVSIPLDLGFMGVHSIWMNKLGENFRSRLVGTSSNPEPEEWETLIGEMNKKIGIPAFEGVDTKKPNHRQLCLATVGLLKDSTDLQQDIETLLKNDRYTDAAACALFEGMPERAVELLKNGSKAYLVFLGMALDIKLKSNMTTGLDSTDWATVLDSHPEISKDPCLRGIYAFITTGDWAAVANEASLPMEDRVGVALRRFDDEKLTEWLEVQMEEAIKEGDIEGIVLSGITDDFVDICAKYVEKFGDYQTPILLLSHCSPRYINDIRCNAWRNEYCAMLHRNQQHILRVKFVQQSGRMSVDRDGVRLIKPPPRQVTIRCLNCDAIGANDLNNTGGPSSAAAAGTSTTTNDGRNPLMAAGQNAGLCCPRCGAHLPRCAVCLEHVGVPRSDKPELSSDPTVRRQAKFPLCCLKCKHITHLEHAHAWFAKHMECPVPECSCRCAAEQNFQQ